MYNDDIIPRMTLCMIKRIDLQSKAIFTIFIIKWPHEILTSIKGYDRVNLRFIDCPCVHRQTEIMLKDSCS